MGSREMRQNPRVSPGKRKIPGEFLKLPGDLPGDRSQEPGEFTRGFFLPGVFPGKLPGELPGDIPGELSGETLENHRGHCPGCCWVHSGITGENGRSIASTIDNPSDSQTG